MSSKVERAVSIDCDDGEVLDISVDDQGYCTVACTKWKRGRAKRGFGTGCQLTDLEDAVLQLKRPRVETL